MPEEPQGELAYLMGGEVDRGYFELVVHGDDLDPDAITQLLVTQPTAAYRKGDLSDNGKYHRRTGSRSLQSGERNFRVEWHWYAMLPPEWAPISACLARLRASPAVGALRKAVEAVCKDRIRYWHLAE